MPFQALQPTPAEQKLIEAAQVGEVADFSTGNKESDDPQKGAEWGPERTVCAELVCALATGRGLPPQLSVRGVRLKGARITHWLNFETARITDPLVLVNCYIEDSIFLHGASVHSLVLFGSYVPNGISGNGLHVDRDLHLGLGFVADSEIVLLGASVGGNLALSRGRYGNPEGPALSMDGIDVGRSIFLRDGFKAKGEVRLLGATIGGQLDCSRGEFENEGGIALNMDNISVKGSIFLREGFRAKGEVSLPDATVGGSLDASEGKFENQTGRALTLENISIKGDLKLGKGFAALGQVSLRQGTITGQVDFSGGKFENANGNALFMDGVVVQRDICLSDGFHAKGEVRLLGVNVGDLVDCERGTFENPGGDALSLNGAVIRGRLLLRKGFRVKGNVSLAHATAGILADDEDSWPDQGNLDLEGFSYTGIKGPSDAEARLKWLGRQRDFHPQPYEQLARVLRQSGHVRDSREVLYAKHRKLRDVGGLGRLARFWDWLLEWTVGYGYKAHRTFWWALGLFIAGSVVAYTGWAHALMVHSRPKENGAAYPVFHATLYSLEQFSLPPLSLGEKSYWRPSERHSHDLAYWGLQGYFIFQGVAGWVLTGLVIAALTGIIKKE